jgi:hypothetical protein
MFYIENWDGVTGFPPFWQGNFASGAPLVALNSGPLTISLPTPVFGGGAQFQRNGLGAFTAEITALDATNNVLASFTEVGLSTSSPDNSAIFIGVLSDTPNISKIQFRLSTGGSFAINQFDFRTTPSVSAVPEPSSLALLGSVAIPLARWGWRRKRRPTD